MARVVSLTDDLDGSTGAKAHRFSVEDLDYEIDLNDQNWAAFLHAIEPFRSVARVERKGAFKLTSEDRVKIRQWAKENGFEIKDRGRFPHAVIQAYFDAIEGDTDAA
jgi:hypothetical protein